MERRLRQIWADHPLAQLTNPLHAHQQATTG